MREKFLPIGTVVLLKEATKRLMITGYCSAKPDEPNKVYDYVAMLFPEGNLAGEDVALFNHDQIGTIVHMGLEDDEFKTLEKDIKKAMASDAEQVQANSAMPVNDLASLPPFTPDNVNKILNQIKSQGDVFQPLQEPTAFNEENIKKPAFQMPTLDGPKPKSDLNKEEVEDVEDTEESDASVEEVPVKEEKVMDGQPVLQLQPIFTDEAASSGESAPATPTDNGISGLARL